MDVRQSRQTAPLKAVSRELDNLASEHDPWTKKTGQSPSGLYPTSFVLRRGLSQWKNPNGLKRNDRTERRNDVVGEPARRPGHPGRPTPLPRRAVTPCSRGRTTFREDTAECAIKSLACIEYSLGRIDASVQKVLLPDRQSERLLLYILSLATRRSLSIGDNITRRVPLLRSVITRRERTGVPVLSD